MDASVLPPFTGPAADILPTYLAILGGYILGSIPFGLVLSSLAGLGDIRRIGSGNIGATNVLRTGNKGLALLTLLLDGGKGAAAVLIAGAVSPSLTLVAGFAAFLGHLYPVWLRFKGGKGVATFLGLLLALAWPLGVVCALTWLVIAVVFRFSSLSALVAALVAPVYSAIWIDGPFALFSALLTILIFWRHRSNIVRLLKGEEPRIGSNKNKPAT
jgi:glycerol-3-phosphate acyltransferase PlsY